MTFSHLGYFLQVALLATLARIVIKYVDVLSALHVTDNGEAVCVNLDSLDHSVTHVSICTWCLSSIVFHNGEDQAGFFNMHYSVTRGSTPTLCNIGVACHRQWGGVPWTDASNKKSCAKRVYVSLHLVYFVNMSPTLFNMDYPRGTTKCPISITCQRQCGSHLCTHDFFYMNRSVTLVSILSWYPTSIECYRQWNSCVYEVGFLAPSFLIISKM